MPTVPLWADTSRREVSYALCNDRCTLLLPDSTPGRVATGWNPARLAGLSIDGQRFIRDGSARNCFHG